MEVLSYLVIGAAISALVQYLKSKWGTKSPITIGIVVALSIVAGSIYFFIKDTSYLQTVVSILAYASAIYALIIKRFEAGE